MASSTARPQLHTTCLIMYVWTQRSWPAGPPFTHLWRTRWWLQLLKSFPPRMSVPNFSERSWPGTRGSGVCGVCSGVQPAVVAPWRPSQELQFPAPSSLCRAYSAVWRSSCGWSWTKGTSSAGPSHQTSWLYDRLISDFRQTERSQDQHEEVIQEDGS